MKKILPFVQLHGNPAAASPKDQLYEKMTSNPAFTERIIQKANAVLYLLDSCPEQKSLVTYSLSIRRFWGKRGKMEAKKGES